MNEAPVLVSVEGPVATLTLNRPAAGNTVNIPLAAALRDGAMRCAQDPAVRCVVVTGAGKLFCGGGDIAAMEGDNRSVAEFLEDVATIFHEAVSCLMHMRKPLVMLVNGPAAGAGLSLAMIGDVVIAARSAHFTAAYGGVGLSPDGGLSWSLPRLVGLRRAQEMIVANRRVGADEAQAIGMLTRVVDDDELAAEGARQAATLAASATAAIGAARALLLDSYGSSLDDQLARETRALVASGGTAECREGLAAFLGRRKPDFAGV